MELLTLIPMLLKALPVILAGILYLLFKREKGKRRQAEGERDGLKASYEIAEEAVEIQEEERKVEEKINRMDTDELAGAYRTGVCDSVPKDKV